MTDFSSALSSQFNGGTITAKSFSLSQNPVTNTVDIALVITVYHSDQLVVALDIPNLNNAWNTEPAWRLVPYDDQNNPEPALYIVNVYTPQYQPAQIDTDKACIVVDILPVVGSQTIQRYFVNPSMTITDNQAWNTYALEISLQAGLVVSRLSRKSGERVDGMYTLGSINGEVELVYIPNYFWVDSQLPPPITRI
jgi:hypothetical protein